MKTEVLSHFQWPELTVVAFLIFFIFFLSVLFWTVRKGSKQLYQHVSDIPFQDGKEVSHER